MEFQISDIVETYVDLVLTPSPTDAVLLVSPDKTTINIHSLWSARDLIRSESTSFSQDFVLQYNSPKFSLLSRGIPCDTSSASLCSFTKLGNKFAVLRKIKKNDESTFLEIWNSSHKERTFDMTDRKEHGKIYDSGDLKSFEWSANEKYLLYVAEAKKKKSESFFKDVFCKKTDDQKPSEEAPIKGEENIFHESWGERYTVAHHSVICILEVETGKVEILNLDDMFPNTTVAQATWGPNDEYIVFVGYKEAPSRLGLIFCANRRSSIYIYNIKSKDVDCLTSDENITVEFPVFSPNLETFVFLQNEAGGPHRSCRKLMKCNWKNKEISTVIDIIHSASEDFAGIYDTTLSSKWWSSDSRLFFFNSFRRSFMETFCVDILSSKIRKIDIDKSCGTCILYDVKDPYVLVSVCSPNVKPHLMIGHFTDSENGIKMDWNLVDGSSHNELQDLSWRVHTLIPSLINKDYSDLDFDIITIASNKVKNGTLMVVPHGGPHSTCSPQFLVFYAACARLGYIICQVNYRGSLGFGENSIRSLLGNIGSQDVSDVVDAIEYLRKDENAGIQNVVGFGGSHGGFLTAHLLGQYPNLLKAAVMINPVIDLSVMAGVSDIPDWCWIESGCSKVYDPTETTNPSFLKEMWQKSPFSYMKDVKSPALLCLGKNDLRVPSSQGLLFYRYLRAQNVPSKVYMYEDNHALATVPVASDVFMQTTLWFQSHLSV